jgi:SAM-dependent methyltransferase
MKVSTRPNDRVQVIQMLAKARNARTYLEIGVQYGDTFFWIKARKKMAVDPRFLFGRKSKLQWIRWNPCNLFNEYYCVESDRFFAENDSLLRKRGLDVVFVDGMHTYEQSLRDIKNALRFLRDDGIVIVDDCNPPDEPASRPVKPEGNGLWCGDVWKTIVHLRSTEPELCVFVLDRMYGLGVIVKSPPGKLLNYSVEEIKNMSYDDFAANRDLLLDLRQSEMKQLGSTWF